MAPLRQADRLGKEIDAVSTSVRGLPLLPEDRVWERVRRAGLDELLQFDWGLVSEADELAALLGGRLGPGRGGPGRGPAAAAPADRGHRRPASVRRGHRLTATGGRRAVAGGKPVGWRGHD